MKIFLLSLLLLSSPASSRPYDPHYYHELITSDLDNLDAPPLLTTCMEMRTEAERILSQHSFPSFVFEDYMNQLQLNFEENLGLTNLNLNRYSLAIRNLLLNDEYLQCSHFLLSLYTTLQAKKNTTLNNINYWLIYQIDVAMTTNDFEEYEQLSNRLQNSTMILQEIEDFYNKWPSNDAIKSIYYYYMKERYNIIVSWEEEQS